MAQPARRITPAPDEPPVDPEAIGRAYRRHRARRRLRVERRREQARARLRFFAVVLLLVAAAAVLLITLWREVQSVFGL
jgi:nitroreductase